MQFFIALVLVVLGFSFLSPLPVHARGYPGNANNDYVVNLADYNILVTQFQQSGTGLAADFNNSGKVDLQDYNILVSHYGDIIPTPTTPQSATPTPTVGVWKPALNTSWQWQLTGLPVDQSVDVVMFDIDLFDNAKSVIDSLHSKGKIVICYYSAGSYEDFRSDANQFPASVLGNNNGWPGEKWLDIRRLDILGPIMKARLDLAKQKECDGVEPDNVDGYTNNTGFPLTGADQLAYNKWTANEAHARGLSVGLKNDVDQISQLVSYYDWALNEQCWQYNECSGYSTFINAGKAVFNVEYKLTTSQFCPQANAMNMNSLKKNLNLDATRTACR